MAKPDCISCTTVPGGWSLGRHLEQRLVEIGVELGAHRLHLADVVALEHVEQLALRQLDAGEQVLRRLVGLRRWPRRAWPRARAACCRRRSADRGRNWWRHKALPPPSRARRASAGFPCRRRCAAAGPCSWRGLFLELRDLEVALRRSGFDVHRALRSRGRCSGSAVGSGAFVSSAMAEGFQSLDFRDGCHIGCPAAKIK